MIGGIYLRLQAKDKEYFILHLKTTETKLLNDSFSDKIIESLYREINQSNIAFSFIMSKIFLENRIVIISR